MTTKEKIWHVALELFSQKGFAGVSVRDIAKEVGVRESALYKHYANKQTILDSIVIKMQERIHSAYVQYQVPEAVREDVAQGYEELSEEALGRMAWKLFELYTKDELISKYRKLLMREQMQNNQLSKLYSDTFLMGVLHRQGHVFQQLVEGGLFRKEDEEIIALQFYGPIYFLFQQYDSFPEQEEAIKQMLFSHVKAFGQRYQKAK